MLLPRRTNEKKGCVSKEQGSTPYSKSNQFSRAITPLITKGSPRFPTIHYLWYGRFERAVRFFNLNRRRKGMTWGG